MRATIIHAPGDIRVETVPDPTIVASTDAIIRTVATCVCGSDLWDYRGVNPVVSPHPIGHEYVGVVEEVGRDVSSVTPGEFVIGSFYATDNTCQHCRSGYQSACVHREFLNLNPPTGRGCRRSEVHGGPVVAETRGYPLVYP
ncbi:alcohol dehydrogenase catalytic domain-containing protein, partial [Rhodococcus pyridinivorans]